MTTPKGGKRGGGKPGNRNTIHGPRVGRHEKFATSKVAAQPLPSPKTTAKLPQRRRHTKTGGKDSQLAVIPAFPTIRVDNARQVFFTRPEFEAVHGALAKRDPDAADACLFSYLTGWRKGEVLALEWAWIDRAQQLVRLPDSKNDDGRVLPLVGALRDLIEKRWKMRALGVTAVFHRKGKPIKRMDRGWVSACVSAGLPGRWFHDFRRSAARDLVEAGNDYAAAMAVTGHRSVQVFRRYRIVDARSTARALALMQDHRASMVTDTVNQA